MSLRIAGARSLKDKRRVVRSFRDRVASRMRVSVAEIGALDDWQRAIFGVAVVANDATRCDQVLAAVARLADDVRDAVLEERATEIVSFGAEGAGVRGELGSLDPAWAGSGAGSAPDVFDGEEDDA